MAKEKLKDEIRKAFADYVATEGCRCCQDREAHEKAAEKLGKLLGCDKYSDGSGYDFYKYKS